MHWRAALIVSATLLASCGHGSGALRSATDDEVRSVQNHEADLARACAIARDRSATCEARCGATRAAVDASAAVCTVTSPVRDTDLRARCDNAKNTVVELQQGMAAACPCTG
ncbi:MAG: hypothetical protein IPK60_01185 [Sandaracinaceae bacterium]|nr:hypothetical protein [Sandaracinaceae bacterium]